MVIDQGGEVVQETEYCTFGLPVSRNGTDADNKYLYNGKEKQAETRWLDYGPRMYMPEIGRFGFVDRYSEKYFSLSPYQYAGNSPSLNIDINGDSIWISHNGNSYLYENGHFYQNGTEYTRKIKGFLRQPLRTYYITSKDPTGAYVGGSGIRIITSANKPIVPKDITLKYENFTTNYSFIFS